MQRFLRFSTKATPRAAPKSGYSSQDYQKLLVRAMGSIAVSGAVLYTYFQYEKSKALQRHINSQNQTAGRPLIGGPFSLVDHNGFPVSDQDYLGKYLLVYFGYTFCPDVCPEELEKMAQVVDSLEVDIVPLFISVDPKRDSIASIKEYLADFSPKFIGLTGTHQQIKKVAKAYRVYYSAPTKAVDDDEADYLVDHSIFFFLMGPDGKYLAHFGKQETASSVVDKIKQLL